MTPCEWRLPIVGINNDMPDMPKKDAPKKEMPVRSGDDSCFETIFSKYSRRPEFEERVISGPNDPGADDDTLFHYVVQYGALKDVIALIALGADVTLPGDIGNTPLQYAAMKGREDVVLILLEAGASPDQRNELGDTAMSWAENGGFTHIVALLRRALRTARKR